jgi:acyl CoA:acetate/3-ketoacid CoA transferase
MTGPQRMSATNATHRGRTQTGGMCPCAQGGPKRPYAWQHPRMRKRALVAEAALLAVTVGVGVAAVAIRESSYPACSSQPLTVHVVSTGPSGGVTATDEAVGTVRCWVQAHHVPGTPEVWISSDDQFAILHASVFDRSGLRVLLDLEPTGSSWRIASVSSL